MLVSRSFTLLYVLFVLFVKPLFYCYFILLHGCCLGMASGALYCRTFSLAIPACLINILCLKVVIYIGCSTPSEYLEANIPMIYWTKAILADLSQTCCSSFVMETCYGDWLAMETCYGDWLAMETCYVYKSNKWSCNNALFLTCIISSFKPPL